jgi:opacity protein-like surface antigen
MKKTLALLFAGLAVAGLSAAPASAADHYVSGNVGLSWMNDSSIAADEVYGIDEISFDAGLSLLGAVGCDYGDYRLEAEIGYQQNDIDEVNIINEPEFAVTSGVPSEGNVSVLSLMANGYYDIDLGGVDLYATAGMGVAQVSFEDFRYGDAIEEDGGSMDFSETTLAWQVGAGLAVPIGTNISLDARYRYFATTDFSIPQGKSDANINIASHNVLLGLRVGF